MYFLVILVQDDLNASSAIYDAWENAGVGGITIIESTGLARVRQKEGFRDDFPLLPSIRNLLQNREEHHRTIFSIVEGEEMVAQLIVATESVIGDLTKPDSGVLFALPLSHVVGVPGRGRDQWTQ